MLTKAMPVDILAIGVHPDDVELCCSGTLLSHYDKGYKFGLLDLTRGELGTRGNADTRTAEAMEAAKMMHASFRIQLDLEDGFFESNRDSIIKIIRVIRSATPKLVIANAISDRHPDHGRSAKLVADAVFYSGLIKINTQDDEGKEQKRWRPSKLIHYIQDHQLDADIVFDISNYVNKKLKIIQCFKSQFYNPGSLEPDSPISGEDFFELIKAKNKTYGRWMDAAYAEGFTVHGPIPVNDFIKLLT